MAVQGLQVLDPVRSPRSGGRGMINLDAVVTPEDESTVGASTTLSPQQMPKGTVGERVLPEALRPVGEVAIE